jgi:thymidine phosphorylase
MMVHKKIGDRVTAGEALCTVYYNSAERLANAAPLIEKSYTIEAVASLQKRALVHQIIGDK